MGTRLRLSQEPRRALLWMVPLLLGMVACDQDRPFSAASGSPMAELRLKVEYVDPAPEARAKSLIADEVRVLVFHLHGFTEGGATPYLQDKRVQGGSSEFWQTHDPDDWNQWRQYVGTVYGFGDLEVDQKLPIEGNLARGTLKVQPGEKFLLVGIFAGGTLIYQGESWALAFPGQPNQTVVEARPFSAPGPQPMEFVWLEPGTFVMGSPDFEPGRNADEGPQHAVTISQGFYLGKYELTQGQWEAAMGTQPWAGQAYVQSNPNHPAVYISWNDVQELIGKLNQAAGENIYRLPTEAEWEYACRAGTSTRWSFGEDESRLGEYGWYDANALNVGEQYAHPVGTKLPNPWGLYDLHGNVYEWCQDWYGGYSRNAQIDPTGPATGSGRVMRGGAFAHNAPNTRSAIRPAVAPDDLGRALGVRLVRIR